jgi:hypothetical protein
VHLFTRLLLRGVLGNSASGASAEKFSEIKALRFMQEGGISIRPVLQGVARVSAESTNLTSSEGTSIQECGYQRTSAAAMPFKRHCFMQNSELPLTRILGNSYPASCIKPALPRS